MGSGTGLGGICMAKLLEQRYPDLTCSIYLTDICTKAIDAIRDNLTKSGNLARPERVSLETLEWGNHGATWAQEKAAGFDLIIASDVVYLPECVDPLIESSKYFLRENTGRCLLVNNLVRVEEFLGQIEAKTAEMGLLHTYEPDIIEDQHKKEKKFKVSLI